MYVRPSRTQLHLFLILALALPLAAIYATHWPALRAAAPPSPRGAFAYIPATGHNIGLAIKRFYETHGGLAIFGLPLTELIEQDGAQVQYFERARFELHPELPAPHYVSLTLVGSLLTRDRADAAFRPQPAQVGPIARIFFPATSHTLGGAFNEFWLQNGQLPVFGYPISEEFSEVNLIDGRPYLVQYFERARFEYHPEALDGFYHEREQANGILLAGLREIWLGDLGRQAAQRKGYAFGTSTQLVGAPDWSPKIWNRRIEVDLTAQHLTAYEGTTPVYQAPVATGKDGFNTPTGSYAIYNKYPIETMTGSGGGETWYVPNIPFVQYVVGGVALHGTYWHDQWGTGFRLSHGCINLNIDDAEWLYEWSDVGTQVDIHY
jgi:L,D-transpeptidase catalytic domain